MYPYRSTIRFQTSHTAVVLKDDRIYQVKSPSNEKVYFDTVDQWVQSLPGPPSMDDLIVTTTESEKKKITEKKSIKKRFHVPQKGVARYGGLNWGRHVYYSIKQVAPALLADEAIMEAYNAFIEVMSLERPICIYSPSGPHKYFRGISLENHDTIPVQCTILNLLYKTPSELQAKKLEILAEYRAAYLPLYELIKRTMVPIIETYAVERRAKASIVYTTKLLMKVVHKQNRVRKLYENTMEGCDYNIEYYKNIIEQEKNIKRQLFEWERSTSEASHMQPCPICATPMCTSSCIC